MTYQVLKNADHRCDLTARPYRGMIIKCEGCGRVYKAYEPGNPNYNKWVPVSKFWAFIRGWN